MNDETDFKHDHSTHCENDVTACDENLFSIRDVSSIGSREEGGGRVGFGS